MVDDETGDRPGDSTDTLVRAQRSRARAEPLAVSASLVLALGAMLAWVGLASRSDSVSDVEATEATVGASSTIDSAPRTLTSIPFCDETSAAIAESYEGPRQPDASFWAVQEQAHELGRSVERAYGSSPAWSGWYIAPDDSLVFRFTDRDPDREAAIAAIVDGHPHSFRQVGFTEAERQRAHDALIEAWEAAGEGHALSGVGVEGLHPLVEIDLSDHDEAASFAEQIGLPPPYDIYCINPREVDTGILLP